MQCDLGTIRFGDGDEVGVGFAGGARVTGRASVRESKHKVQLRFNEGRTILLRTSQLLSGRREFGLGKLGSPRQHL